MTTVTSSNPVAAAAAVDLPPRGGSVGGGRGSAVLPTGWLGVPVRAWWIIGTLSALFVALYWTSLIRLWLKTNPINAAPGNEWPHAVFVPIVGIYYLYLNLDELLKARVRPLLGLDFTRARFLSAGLVLAAGAICWRVLPMLPGPFGQFGGEIGMLGKGLMLMGVFGLLFDWGIGSLLAGLLTYAWGIWPGAHDFIKDIGMVMTVFGMVLTVGGWSIMRIAWFPCLFLFCALPWPGLFYSKLAMPMQELSAMVGVGVMQVSGVEVEKIGTTMLMTLPGDRGTRSLDVAEACAGLKSLMTFVATGAAIAFLMNMSRPLWQKIVIVASAVPIAILCNALRVTGQGLLDYYVDQSWSTGFAHQFAGIVFLLPGFLMLMGMNWLLDKLFIDEDDTQAPGQPTAPQPAAGNAAGNTAGVRVGGGAA